MTPSEYNTLKRERPDLLLPALVQVTHYEKLIAVISREELITEITEQMLQQDDHPGYYWSLMPIWIKHMGRDESRPWHPADIERV